MKAYDSEVGQMSPVAQLLHGGPCKFLPELPPRSPDEQELDSLLVARKKLFLRKQEMTDAEYDRQADEIGKKICEAITRRNAQGQP